LLCIWNDWIIIVINNLRLFITLNIPNKLKFSNNKFN
jgi:hypothetical protein